MACSLALALILQDHYSPDFPPPFEAPSVQWSCPLHSLDGLPTELQFRKVPALAHFFLSPSPFPCSLSSQLLASPDPVRKYPVGISDYKEIVQDGYFYWDRTLFLKEFYDDVGEVAPSLHSTLPIVLPPFLTPQTVLILR